MTKDVGTTYRIAEDAIESLQRMGLAASPRNFELWYTYADGANLILSRDIDQFLADNGQLDQTKADALYERHIASSELANTFLNLVSRFESEVGDLFETIERTGANADGNGKKLSALSLELDGMTGDQSDVGTLLEGVIAVTKSMKDQNQKLESRLAASTNEISHLRHSVESIQLEAMTDALTGMNNRKSFDKSMSELTKEAKTNRSQMALIFADIDHFKKFNDRWGHQTGDQVLRLVAEVMKSNLKGKDLLARYGGEEFAIILPDTTMDNARMLAERIRTAVESRRLKKRRTNETLGAVTLSLGITAFEDDDTPETLIERADERLYAAKNAGRNRVVCDGDPESANWEDEATFAASV